ncbi:Zn-ribbon domain-containing OB-fold protein [Frankia nepalensis]|uniref:OB-fold domain-containing protein n=1 Tax=Frankia nepalensis TaxID=1836974 RepID=A0A937UVB5_9ACTN|nr:zinc ribbon domain-containing protein [Frankia nepalensis]MBL7497759.1 OB-fold domain-containing protein [Frankia nepalensis]MBL7512019.1 OB-fold domain-containing protein [Frankia nepalensis]MBL7632071.1 OB-fold domain-containing protein [Frankia nepalensis]
MVADFLPDRWQQILASLDLPIPVTDVVVTAVRPGAGFSVETLLRWTGPDGGARDVRLRWVPYEGSWRVQQARNLPARLPDPVFPEGGYPPVEAGHWVAMNQGELRVQRCSACRTWIWGPRHLCPRCRSFELGYAPVAAEGLIFAWTRTVQPFEPSMAGRVPFVVALVELPQAGGVRVAALLEPTPDAVTPAIGDPVDGHFVPFGAGDRKILRWRLSGRPGDADGQTGGDHDGQ